GFVHGLWTDRWRVAPEIDEAAARLPKLPRVLGDWRGSDLKLDQRQLARGGVAGHVARRYENPLTGTTVNVVVVCGRPGHIAAHTPDVCYGGAGYLLEGTPETQTIKDEFTGQEGQFLVARFTKQQGAVQERLRLFYAWKGSGSWEAPA